MTAEPSVAFDPSARPPAAEPGAGMPAGLDWLMRLPSAAAPGFVYLAGAVGGVPVGGGGADLGAAAARLTGETAEVRAQVAEPDASTLPGDAALDAIWTAAPAPLRIAAETLDGRPLGVPAAAIFLRGRAEDERRSAAPPTSLGLAAGPDREAARLAGLLELIERDAAARWWCEGARPRQADAASLARATTELVQLRTGAAIARPTGFFALDAKLGVPVVCAFSADPDGRGLAFGLKAAPDPAAAASGALAELMQMELALEMARHRAARGAPAASDLGPLARAALDPSAFPAFAALPPAPFAPVPGDFAGLAAALAGSGQMVAVADLPGAGPVAKVFVPGLRPLPGGSGRARAGTPGAAAPLM